MYGVVEVTADTMTAMLCMRCMRAAKQPKVKDAEIGGQTKNDFSSVRRTTADIPDAPGQNSQLSSSTKGRQSVGTGTCEGQSIEVIALSRGRPISRFVFLFSHSFRARSFFHEIISSHQNSQTRQHQAEKSDVKSNDILPPAIVLGPAAGAAVQRCICFSIGVAWKCHGT